MSSGRGSGFFLKEPASSSSDRRPPNISTTFPPSLAREDTPATPISASLGVDKHGKFYGGLDDGWGYISRAFDTITKLTVLTFKLIHMIGFTVRAYIMIIRLIISGLLMMIPAIPCVWWWYTADNIVHGIPYGPLFRQNLDIYLPNEGIGIEDEDDEGFPVAVCYTGGAWLVGYKCWLCRLAQTLCLKHGVLVVLVDYRNVPQATMPQMVEDVSLSLQWVQDNIKTYGGDVNRVLVAGQSAGAHLVMMSLLHTAIRKHRLATMNPEGTVSGVESSSGSSSDAFRSSVHDASPSATLPTVSEHESDSRADNPDPAKSPPLGMMSESELCAQTNRKYRNFSSFALPPPAEPGYNIGSGYPARAVLFSGAYDLVSLLPALHERGLYHSFMKRVSGYNLKGGSPSYVVDRISPDVAQYIPPIDFFHGDRDKTIPETQTSNFQLKLQHKLGCKHTSFELLEGQTHTDPMVEMPLLGKDPLAEKILKTLRPGRHPETMEPLAGETLVNIIRVIMPF